MANSQQTLPWYLLSIRGTLAPATLEAARQTHNSTAGASANVAAARAMGEADLQHALPGGVDARAGVLYIPLARALRAERAHRGCGARDDTVG